MPPAQRDRIRATLLDLLAERPYPEIELADLLERAHLSATDFERQYPDLDSCFAELCQDFMREAAEYTFAAYAAEGSWREGMRAQIWASYDFLLEDRLRARIAVIDTNFGGEQVKASRDLFMAAFTELVHLGRHEREGGERIPKARAEAIAGASWERIAAPINAGDFERLAEVVPPILYMLFLPYLGEEVARAEMQLARTRARSSPAHTV